MVSIIMGVYNTANYKILEKAILSILEQTYENFEFIICDDGSTDNTYALLTAFAKKDLRIRLLKNSSNRGLPYTLNRCLAEARGDYIARMDADDVSLPNRLEREIDFLISHAECSFVGCNVYYLEGESYWGQRILPSHPNRKDFLFNSPFIHPTIMIRTEALRKIGGYHSEAVRAEDYDLWMRLYATGCYGVNLQEFLFAFREDRNAYRRRKYRYRFYETKVRWHGFWSLGLMPWALPYVLKPLFVGLIPQSLLAKLRIYKGDIMRKGGIE